MALNFHTGANASDVLDLMEMARRSGLAVTLRVYALADRITAESAAHGDFAESGYTNGDDAQTIYAKREDVLPIYEIDGVTIVSERDDVEDAKGYLEAARGIALEYLGEFDRHVRLERGVVPGAGDEVNYQTGDVFIRSTYAELTIGAESQTPGHQPLTIPANLW